MVATTVFLHSVLFFSVFSQFSFSASGSSDAPTLVERQLNFSAMISAGNSSGGPTIQELGHSAGYYNLPHSKSAKMFYLFFESRNISTDPVVIWLAGGPGCSGTLAVFYENGPFKVLKDHSLVWNDFGWDKVSNLIYVDQPIGTGFSYTNDNSSDIRHDEAGVSTDLYDFLQAFFKDHPKLASNDFYIAGESYAGHYIPALASRIQSENSKNQSIQINLKGISIGNGLTYPEIQFGACGDYALEMKLISESLYESLKQDYVGCQNSTERCNLDGGSTCLTAYEMCDNIYDRIWSANQDKNLYDLRMNCSESPCDYDLSSIETFLNQDNVREALGVGNITFFNCSTPVFEAMKGDFMLNLEVKIPALVEDGISVLIYAGEYDLICNWLGISRWVEQMHWSGQKEFVSAKTISFLVDGKEAGLIKNHGPLTFLKVHDAGHLVTKDQPKASLQMIQTWMKGELTTAPIVGH